MSKIISSKENDYGINDIESLSFKDGVRKRIPMYLGTDDTEGIYQALKEVVNNSTDEALMGYGNKIKITVNEKENYVSVTDEGRGIPFGIRDNGENVLVSIFSKAHTGGKFNNKNYTTSSGLNGIGIKATCLSSEKFEAQSIRNGKGASVYFEKGELINYKEFDTKSKNGTYVRFKPDKEVFKNMEEGFLYKRICDEIKNISYLNKKIHFIVKNDLTNEEKDFYSENGIADFIKDKVKNPLMKKPIIATAKDDTDEIEIAFIWTSDPTQDYVFVNGLYCAEGGSPVTGAKTKITTKIKSLSGKNFDAELIRKGLVFAINCKVTNPSFANQTKSKINNPSLRTLASQAFDEGLNTFANTPEFSAIIEMMDKFQKAEKAADRAREAILNHNKEMTEIRKNKLAFIEKLSDAEILGQDSILCVVEGDSAGSSVAMGRDTKRYGILRLRGKMKNAMKAQDEEIYKNEEIKLLLYALGIDINHYDAKKLRYGKIAILVDPDSDGYHIALLVMANLHRLCPQFLQEGRLFWLRSPLFIEEDKNDKPVSWYYTDEEFNAVRGKLKGHIKRIKGLGGLSEADLKATLFSTTGGQMLDEVEYSSEGAERLCELMGVDVQPRKDFVFSHIDFSKYGNM